ncbi:efflux RND transporter permease subunit [Exilibacterium tricleocarpae]|uniref:Efflux RND transporter permease subunit n=1 Tax=Exilibacterium tricleocarpae TaxID=2591008 RepID=A0A545TBB7_9GAMM|nr:efflux RND transporter permease subunit [Exilibacterium tricleocarpae]TQV74494.1 efflux RND transporter permease subunit [Exilibacterium tricleocarpae]
MTWLTRWFLDNPVAANLLMVLILVGGTLSLGTLRVESFPQTPPTQLVISVVYPGGTARQVDDSITQRIEDAISSVAGVHRITSESRPGLATIRVKKTTGTDLDRLMEDVRNRVDSIVGFPAQAERPQIYRDEFTNLAAFVLVAGDMDADVLQRAATRVERALKSNPAISQVTNLGKRQPQLLIEPHPETLKRYGLGLENLADQVGAWSLEYRSGELKTAHGKLVLKGDGYADNLLQLQRLPVVTTGAGTVTLGDVAHIRRTYEEDDARVRYQGQAAIALLVSTSTRDNLFHVSAAVQEELAAIKTALPVGVSLDVMADMSPYIKEQLDLLSTNAWQGLLIVLVLLGLFLDVRLAFWVALGIPVSIAGALWLMDMPGIAQSINDITLFGMILVLGILVDDAVVVGESIHAARQRLADPRAAAQAGVESVAVATVFGVLTTIAAFSPMLWIDNELARVLAGFSMVVILALIFSLIESKFILPSHLCLSAPEAGKRHRLTKATAYLQAKCSAALETFSRGAYLPLLKFSLGHRGAILLLFTTVLILAYGLLLNGQIRSTFFPEIPGRYVTATVTMNQDAPLTLTLRNAGQLEAALSDINRGLQRRYKMEAPPVARQLVFVDGAAEIELTAELSAEALRKLPGKTFLQAWQAATGALEGSYASRYSAADDVAGGTLLAVSAPERELARRATAALKKALSALPGVNDVYDDGQGGQRQLELAINARGRQLGLDKYQLATLVGGAYGGLEVNRLLARGEDTKVLVRFAERQRRTLEQLMSTPVSLGNGNFVPLGEVVDSRFSRQPETVYRRNRSEVVNVYWRQDRGLMSPEAIWATLQQEAVPALERRYPGVSISALGEFEEITEVQAGFKKAMLLTLLLIYALLAIPLKSYWQPLIIMSVIPFGFAGAIFGHGLMGLPVSILSLFGMMAMTGVVINDSLVLITRFNQLFRDGMPLREALIEAGRSRLRAIFLTTATTAFGLLPLLSETSEQAQYLKPAAVSLVFGELFATPITLLLIPVLLHFGHLRRDSVQPVSELKLTV